MRDQHIRLAIGVLVISAITCGTPQTPLSPALPASTNSLPTASEPAWTSAAPDAELFSAAESGGLTTPAAHAARSRLVKVNLSLLMDEQGQARPLPPNAEIRLNLFPDVAYTGVIEGMQQEGDGYSWTGYLKDVEYSQMYMVYTSGVFIGHFASPAGVYEVSNVEGDLYQMILIDQSQFQGGDEPTPRSPTSTPG